MKVSLVFTFLVSSCALLVGGVYHNLYRERALKTQESQMSSSSKILASTLGTQWANIYPNQLQTSIEKVARLPEFEESKIEFEVQLADNGLHLAKPIILARSSSYSKDTSDESSDLFTLTYPIYNGGESPVALLLTTGNRGALEKEITTAYSVETGIALGLIMLIGFIGYRNGKRFTKPLKELVEGISKLKNGQLGHEVKLVRYDEFGILIDSFNSMSIALDQADKRYKRNEKDLLKTQKELIEARDKSEQSAKAKTAFLANMSHEIRTPINGIIGLSDILIEHCTNPEQRRLLDTIINSSNSLMGIVNDVLDFSKIEAGKMELFETPIDLKEFFNDLSLFYQPLAASKGIQMITQVDERIPDRLMVDGLRLRQVITNLLSNALKFTKEGYISLQTKVIRITNSDVVIKVSIQDSGIGIDEKQQERLFKAFSQADESTTRQYGGTGLGLVISQSIIDMMDSRITLSSKLGRGSIFAFAIKLEMPTDEELQTELNSQNQIIVEENCLLGVRGLIADDSKVNRIAIEHQMQKLGVDFDLVENGQEALDAAVKNSYDFILMDVSMPIMDGLEATRRIREIEKSSHESCPTQIIAMTANAFSEQKDACLKAGMDDFLTKPAKLHQIAEKIFVSLERSDPKRKSDRFEVISNAKGENSRLAIRKRNSNTRISDESIDLIDDESESEDACDFQFIDEQESVYGDEIWDSVVDEFLLEAGSTYDRLIQGFEKKEYTQMASYAHKFKGEVGIMGYGLLAEKLDYIQHIEEHGIDEKDLESKINEVSDLYQGLFNELKRRRELARN